jgi:hypothetical protein
MNPATMTQLLQQYGPWAVVVMQSLAIIAIWSELKEERKRRDAEARGFYINQIQTTKDMSEQQARFSDVLKAFARRNQ